MGRLRDCALRAQTNDGLQLYCSEEAQDAQAGEQEGRKPKRELRRTCCYLDNRTSLDQRPATRGLRVRHAEWAVQYSCTAVHVLYS